MASIYKEFKVLASPQFVWDAIKDVGAVHERLAKGFVTSTTLEGTIRTVTFANGFVVKEEIVSIDNDVQRMAYRSVGGKASHHNAYFQLFPAPEGGTKIVWVTDLLPDDMKTPIAQMVELGAAAIVRTLELSFTAKQ